MNQEQPKQRFWYRVKFITLIVVFLSPFIGGWLALYVFELRPSSGNYGTLIAPVKKLEWPVLRSLDGEIQAAGFGRKWTLLLFSGDNCSERCRTNLHYMRQLRILLGRDTARLQNVLISAQPLTDATNSYLQEFPDLKVIENNRDPGLYDQFQQVGFGEVGEEPKMYLVDPDQNLMMHYPAENDQNRILEDIKKLMKLSQIG